jgi:alkanesulfonate monooxygenase SsuD/methylene tetrahydromethanopterin reductase-like flavin-dependent oxidoreductase (luciferase family)
MTPEITFGFGMITAQHDPRDARTDTEIYTDVIDLCVLAEELGYDAVWLSEHHFVDDGYMSSLLPVAAAIAARTTDIRIATGIIVAPLHDPLRLAEDAATVDVISGGRLVLGIGAGYRDEEFAGLGRDKTGLGATLDRTISTLRDAWDPAGRARGGPDTAPVSVTPKPAQAGGPPVWLGARTKAGIRRTAQRADGLLAARVTPDELGDQVALLHVEMAACGRTVGEVSVGVHCPVLAWPGGTAWEVLETHLHYSEWKYKDMGRQPYGERTPDAGPGVPPQLSDETREILRAGAIVGTPEQVAESVIAFARSVGDAPFQFIPRLYWPGMDPEIQREALRVFAEDVVPIVRAEL